MKEGIYMKWEDLTVLEFKESLKETKGVAIIPIGCLEKHGYHMPLGTDMFIAKTIAEKAAEKEEALVVPIAPYGIISEAQHRYGCLSISESPEYARSTFSSFGSVCFKDN